MQQLVGGLLMWAASLSHYPEPETPPNVLAVPHEQLEGILCGGQRCHAVAYYDHESASIFFDESLNLDDSITAKSFVVHEMVHYLQHQAGKMTEMPMPCKERIALEREAYITQQKYLRQHHTLTYQVQTALRLLGNICKTNE